MRKSSWNILADVKPKNEEENKKVAKSPRSLDALVALELHRRACSPAKSDSSDVKRGSIPNDPFAGPENRGVSEHIGKGLRELYGDMLSQPVPDRFLELLNRLEASTMSPLTKAKRPGGG
jgi:hypothetical protein